MCNHGSYLVSSGFRQWLVLIIGLKDCPLLGTDGVIEHGSPWREKNSPPPNEMMITPNTIRNCKVS